jgi:dTDP-4-dehydrorhamnose reductase
MVCREMNFDEGLITKVDASTFTQPAQRPLRTPFDISKAQKELNYDPVSFYEGMRKVIGLVD